MDLFLILLYSVLAFYLLGMGFYFLEKFHPVDAKQGFITKDFWTETGFFFFNELITEKLLFQLVLLALLQKYAPLVLPDHLFAAQIQALPVVVQVFLALLVMDLIVYVRHYFTHVYLWDVPAVHHAAEQISWVTGFRLHPVEVLLAAVFQYLVLYILGFGGQEIVYAGYIMMVFNLYTHTNIAIEYPGILRYLISSPNYHRWHHATEKEAINKNFVVVFPFIDLLFGTFYYPVHALPKRYGIYNSSTYEAMPKGFFKQLWYPFQCLKRVKKQ